VLRAASSIPGFGSTDHGSGGRHPFGGEACRHAGAAGDIEHPLALSEVGCVDHRLSERPSDRGHEIPLVTRAGVAGRLAGRVSGVLLILCHHPCLPACSSRDLRRRPVKHRGTGITANRSVARLLPHAWAQLRMWTRRGGRSVRGHCRMKRYRRRNRTT
jgi:hypothetical protein